MALKTGSRLGRGGSVNRFGSDGGSITPPVVLTGTPVDLLLDFETGAAGNLVTAAGLHQIGTAWSWAQSRTPLEHTRVSGSNFALRDLVAVAALADYDGAGTRGIYWDLDEAVVNSSTPFYEELTGTPPGTYDDLIVGVTFKFDLTGDAQFDHVHIAGGGSFVTLQHSKPGNSGGTAGDIHIETQHSGITYKGTPIPVALNTKYRCYLFYGNTLGRVAAMVINDTTGVLVGTSESFSDIDGPVEYVKLQDYIIAAGGTMTADNFVMAWGANAVLPLEPFTTPDPTSVSAAQTDTGEVTLSWASRSISYKIERQHSGAWSTLETSIAAPDLGGIGSYDYVDDGLADGETYNYRVTALNYTHSSSAVASGAVEIDDSPFAGAWQDVIASGSTDSDDGVTTGTSLGSKIVAVGNKTCGRLRVYAALASVAGDHIKMALYDNSGNLLTSEIYDVPFETSTDWREVTLSTPVSVTNGSTYWIRFTVEVSIGVRFLNAAPAGSADYSFGYAYAAFPPATWTADGTLTRKYAVGMYCY